MLNIVQDPVEGLLWSFTEDFVFKYVIRDESRNIWKIYLEKQEFSKAEEYSNRDPEKMQEIAMKQGDYFFAKKE